jgi:hypothetical protein
VTPPTTVPPGPVGDAVGGAGATGGTVTVPVEAPAIPDISAGLADIAHSSVTVIITADTTQAWSAVQLFKAASTVPAVVKVNADVAEANSLIRSVIAAPYLTIIHLAGDPVPVNGVIRSVISANYSTIVHVDGDNSGAISAIRSITTGYYSATVHINGDASGFYSVWNALPSSKTITVTVNQVQGATVPTAPPAAPGGLLAPMVATQQGFALNARGAGPVGFAAPTAAGGNSSGATVININVGVGDADVIARKVKQVMLQRDRRTGGVVIGDMRSRVGHS